MSGGLAVQADPAMHQQHCFSQRIGVPSSLLSQRCFSPLRPLGRRCSLSSSPACNRRSATAAARRRSAGFRRGRGVHVAGTAELGAVLAKTREFVQFGRKHGYDPDELIDLIRQSSP
jgi:hypothetical protein